MLAALLAAACGPSSGETSAIGAADADSLRGLALPEPLAKPSAVLTDTDGRPYDLRAETEGRLTFLFFGYTHCPDVCPVHMGSLAAALDHLGRDIRARTRVVFVTTDPARDTPAVIRKWLDRFHRDFVGLRGSSEEVGRIQDSLRMPRSVTEAPDADGNYLVGHAAQVVAFAPDGRTVFYPFGIRTVDWVHDIPLLLGAPAAPEYEGDTLPPAEHGRHDSAGHDPAGHDPAAQDPPAQPASAR